MIKEDDHDAAMVCMIMTRRGRHSTRITARSSNPIEGEESYNASEGHETPVSDEEAPLINKNTGGTASPVLQAIDDDIFIDYPEPQEQFLTKYWTRQILHLHG